MEAIKKILRDLAISGVAAATIPVSVFLGVKMMKLQNVAKTTMKLGQRAAAPVLAGAQGISGRIADAGARGGFIKRTFARAATGAFFPGGRARMERVGADWGKARSERGVPRDRYRPGGFGARTTPEALEKADAGALAALVARADGGDARSQGAVDDLRRMYQRTPNMRLSTAQYNALFGGSGLGNIDPLTGAPAGGPPIPRAPAPRESGARLGDWWREHPTLTPGRRTDDQRWGRAVLGWAGDWRTWSGSLFRGSTRVNPSTGATERVWPRYRP